MYFVATAVPGGRVKGLEFWLFVRWEFAQTLPKPRKRENVCSRREK